MAVNELGIEITSDVSQFNQGMNEATSKVEKFKETTDDAKDSVDVLGKKGAMSTRELLKEIGKLSGSEKGIANYRRQLGQMTKDIQDLTVNYRNMSKEMQQSEIGQATLQRIQELTVKASEYKDAIMDAQQSVAALASDTAIWDGMKMGIETASSALQTFVSTGVLGERTTEDLVKVIAKLKAAEAATNGVIKIGNALQKNSALMMSISALQAKALAKAKDLETVATGKATIAQKLFNAVAKANPYVLLAAAILAVVTAIGAWTIATRKNNSETERARQIQEGYNKAIKDGKTQAADSIAKFELLRAQYASLRTEGEKTEWIKDNKDKFNELGVELNNIADAQKWLVDNADKFIKALTLEAEAAALMSYYQEEYKKGIEASLKAEEKASRTSALGPTKAQRQSGQFKEGVDYTSRTIISPSTVGAVSQTIYEWTPEGEKKAKEFGQEAGKAVLDGYSNALSPAAQLAAQKLAEAKELRAQSTPTPTPTNNNNNNNNNNNKPEKNYKSQLEQLKKQLQTLEEQKKDIIEGTDAWREQLQKINDVKKQIEELEKAEAAYIESLNRAPRPELTPLEMPDISKLNLPSGVKAPEVKITPVFAEDRLRELLSAAESAAEKVKERFNLGLIDADTARQLIENINAGLEAAGIRTKVEVDIEVNEKSLSDAIGDIRTKFDTIQGIFDAPVQAINGVVSSFKQLNETLEDPDKSGWEQFFAVFQAGMSILDAVSTVMGVLQTVTELLTIAKQKNAVASGEEAVAAGAAAAAHTAEVAPAISAAAAEGALAGAEGASAVAAVPIAGPILAVAAIASIMAAVIAMLASAKGFETGGIVGGHSYTGDKILTRLNSQEMILNMNQQKRLWKEMNQPTVIAPESNNSLINSDVTFKIHGQDLVGTLNNYNSRRNKI